MNIDQKKYITNLINSGEFKGQKDQDKWVLLSVLPFLRHGYFLDLAAADGVLHSNTYVLEKHFGWNGLCIEPNPEFYRQLVKNRCCQFESAVVSDKVEMLDFRVDNGQLGGIVSDDTDNSEVVRGDQLPSATIIQLESKTINDILLSANAPKVIDYFSLDVEGSEERIISTLDFDAYQFKCLTIERPTERVNEILFSNGYVFVKNFSFDSFYVHPQIMEEVEILCDPFEQVPKKQW